MPSTNHCFPLNKIKNKIRNIGRGRHWAETVSTFKYICIKTLWGPLEQRHEIHGYPSLKHNPFASQRASYSHCHCRDYKNGDDLHVGVSASEGTVYNYDERGLHCDMIGWNQCVAVNIATRICDVDKNWDTSLKAMLASGVWSLDR